MELVVALVSDLHFGPAASFGGKLRKLTAEAPALARAFVDRMNEVVKPDLVVNLGDDIEDEGLLADRERYAACIGVLRGAKAELFHVAGNHDLVHLDEADLLAAWGRPELRRLYYSFERGGFHFTVLHTRERRDQDISVGEEQLAWLAEDLAATRLPRVVLMHHSAADQDLRGNRWFEGSPHLCLVRERRALQALFEQHGVLAVFNGHLHWNHLDVIRGVPYVTLQSLIENLDEDAPGRPAAAHAVVRLSPDRIVVEIEGAERARYQFDTSHLERRAG
jgi:3',5'-cyclic-AMP phosphodiesterase